MKDWTTTDFWKFTSEHQDVTIEVWGGWVGKNDGFEPWGWMVGYETMFYYFDLDGKLVKSKAM